MGKYSFPDASLLIVDDENFSRITVLRLLKNLGDPKTESATNGLEAFTILEQRAQYVDCVIADFNMPVMHGLQLLKRIRTGASDIPRNMPVIMLTGHGDTCLVNLAIELDVNTFILKPATADALGQRLSQILIMDKDDESWIKSVEDYEQIDVDTPIVDILKKNAKTQVKIKSPKPEKPEPQEYTTESVQYRLGDLKEWMQLAKTVSGPTGQVFIRAGTNLSRKHIEQLKGLLEMKLIEDAIFIKK
ncbi:response regulator [bacterium]|nr:response regulator [bacterium]